MKADDLPQLAETLANLNEVQDKLCLTIISGTSATRTNNNGDRITFKNLMEEARKKLKDTSDSIAAKTIDQQLDRLQGEVELRQNHGGVALFVNEDMDGLVHLPYEVRDRVILDQTFATRDLLRMLHARTSYYVLVLSREKALLIEALNDRVVVENPGSFPVSNTKNFPKTHRESASGRYPTQLIRQFFNTVDDALHEVKRDNDLPVVVCTERSNFPEYLKISAFGKSIVGHLNENRLDESAQQIVRDAWPIADEHRKKTNRGKLQLMESEYKRGHVETDLGNIWRAISEGRGRLLFVNSNFFQRAHVNDDNACLLNEELSSNGGTTYDDVIDEMVEQMYRFGGDAIFLDDNDSESDFENLALITRY